MLDYEIEHEGPKTKAGDTPVTAPVRVLLLDFWCFIPYYMAELAKALAGQSIEAKVLASSYRLDPGFFARQSLRNNAGFLDFVSRWKVRFTRLRQLLKLFEYCCNLLVLSFKLSFRGSRPDIIHVQYLALLSRGLPLELMPLKAAQLFGVKIVCTVHNLLPHDTGERHRRAFGVLYRMADALICHNETTGERLAAEFGIAPGRIHIIPHGPLQQMEKPVTRAEARQELQLPAGLCIVLWQGVIVPYKGIDFLLDAWRAVGPGAYLVIAGTGDDASLAQLRKRVAAMNGDAIRLDLFFIPPERLPLYYQAADILVYSYSQITTSGALMTGLGYGKAIIATKLPTFTEMLEDESEALLVPYGDSAALAHAVNRIMLDGALRAHLEQGASRVAEQYSWSHIAAKTRACYEDCLDCSHKD